MYIFFVPHKYPVEVVVLCPDVETIKGRERYREKTGYSGFTVETLYDTFMQTTPRIGLAGQFQPNTTADSRNHSERQKVGMIVTYKGKKNFF